MMREILNDTWEAILFTVGVVYIYFLLRNSNVEGTPPESAFTIMIDAKIDRRRTIPVDYYNIQLLGSNEEEIKTWKKLLKTRKVSITDVSVGGLALLIKKLEEKGMMIYAVITEDVETYSEKELLNKLKSISIKVDIV
ncbi:MAG: hypothetical protein KAH32_08195 [Chlamydiia bacterium]|nr:hypothetical protein [Chlamydiia bacterium]